MINALYCCSVYSFDVRHACSNGASNHTIYMPTYLYTTKHINNIKKITAIVIVTVIIVRPARLQSHTV